MKAKPVNNTKLAKDLTAPDKIVEKGKILVVAKTNSFKNHVEVLTNIGYRVYGLNDTISLE